MSDERDPRCVRYGSGPRPCSWVNRERRVLLLLDQGYWLTLVSCQDQNPSAELHLAELRNVQPAVILSAHIRTVEGHATPVSCTPLQSHLR